MQNPQQIFNQIIETKRKIKQIKSDLKGQYEEISRYKELQEDIKKLRAERKQVTLAVDEANPKLIIELEDLKIDLASDKTMLNDIVVSTVMRGETVELKNQYEQPVLPMFEVLFKSE